MNDRESKTIQEVQTLFSPDTPIRSEEEDRLSRSKFVERVGEAIKGWRNQESLVLAIYGEWGSGKSSVKNLLQDYLEKSPEPKPLLLNSILGVGQGRIELSKHFLERLVMFLVEAVRRKRTDNVL